MTDLNPFKLRACKVKAELMAEWLVKFKATPTDVAGMNEDGWKALAALADVRWTDDSDDDHSTTKQMVIGILAMPQLKSMEGLK